MENSKVIRSHRDKEMTTTDLLKLQKELEERERVLAERAKQQEHQRIQLAMESQHLAKVRAEIETARREEPCGDEAIVKEVIVKRTVGNMFEFSMKKDGQDGSRD